MKNGDWILLVIWLLYVSVILAWQDLDPAGYRELQGLLLFIALPLGWMTILRYAKKEQPETPKSPQSDREGDK